MLPLKFQDIQKRRAFYEKENVLVQKKFLFKNLLNRSLLHDNSHFYGMIGLLFLK
jgi:hypothetical protein